jgi:hypothetical protein
MNFANQFGINLPGIGQALEQQEQNALRKMIAERQLQAADEERAGRNAFAQFLGGDQSQMGAAMAYKPEAILGMQRERRAMDEKTREAMRTEAPVLGRLFANVNSPETYAQAVEGARQAGLSGVERLPQQFDPAIVGRIVQTAQAFAPEAGFELKEGADGVLYRVPKAGGQAQRVEGFTGRPKEQAPIFQDMPTQGDRIQRVVSYDGGKTFQNFGQSYDRREPFIVQEVRLEDGSVQRVAIPRAAIAQSQQAQPAGQPAAPAAGGVPGAPPGAVPIGAPSPPKLTEGQSNAALYATRMEEADQIINNLGMAGTNVIAKGMSQVPGVGNYLVPENFRQLQQAQRNFVNAVLRRESGAVINPDEFENAAKQYFPQPGDDQGTIQQKAANRRTAIQGISNAAGPAMKAPKGGQPMTVQTPQGNVTIREIK